MLGEGTLQMGHTIHDGHHVYSAGLFLTGRIKDITKKTLSSQHQYKGHYYTLLRITTYLPIALIKKEILSSPAV